MDDLWGHVIECYQEAKQLNKNKEYANNMAGVFDQLPFFACTNKFYDEGYQRDIQQYLYCDDTKTPPYKGSYQDLPSIWKEKHFLIKSALAILYKRKKAKLEELRAQKGKNYGK